MSNKKTKAAIFQWLIPSAIFLCIVIIMMVNFSITSKQEAVASIEEDFVISTSIYAEKLKNKIDIMTKTAMPSADMVSKHRNELEDLEMSIVQTLAENSEAYMVLLVDTQGKGVTSEGRNVNIKEEVWYSQLDQSKQHYYYTPNDTICGQNAVVSVIPISDTDGYIGSIVMYYEIDNFKTLVKQVEYDNDNCYVIMDKNGDIMLRHGKASAFLEGDNLFETLKTADIYESTIEKTKLKVGNRLEGNLSASIGEEYKHFTYVPIGINDWMLVSCVNQSYVDKLVSRYYHRTESIIYKLIMALVVFIGLIVVVNVINRIRSIERSKTLEDKADTDLLTELNNKIATERKIKEFIAEHPNSQSLMFLLDIDNFKKINDTMGHAFGDEVLRTLGLEIKAEFRVSDIIGRSGGDEFTIFLKNLPNDETITKEADKVARFFKSFKAGEYVKYSATASIGCAVFPRDGADFETLYKAADKALYKAKKRGKNQLAFYNDSDDKREGVKVPDKEEAEAFVKEPAEQSAEETR